MLLAMLMLGILPLAFLPGLGSSADDGDDDTAEDDREAAARRMGDDAYGHSDGDVLRPVEDDDTGGDDGWNHSPLRPQGGADSTPENEAAVIYRMALPDAGAHYVAEDDPFASAADLLLADGAPVIHTDGALTMVEGGAGADTIDAGGGAMLATGGAGDDLLLAGIGPAGLHGGEGEDTLIGTDTGQAFLDGGAGDDSITGGVAAEMLEGGEHEGGAAAGNDTLEGGAGDDTLRGGYGADLLDGGEGNDVIDHLGHAGERIVAEHHEFALHIDNDADTLQGGTGNDTLIFDRADHAEGGAGDDVFWLYFDTASGAGHAEIEDFVPGEDFLRVTLNPHAGYDEITLDVQDEGADARVMVNGETVAMLRGGAGASPADVYVEMRDDVFPAGS